MEHLMSSLKIKHILIMFFSIFTLFNSNSFAQNSESGENNWDSHIGPFTSKFEIPAGWKDGSEALAKAANLYEREGMSSKINFAISSGQEALFIASWQDFKPTLSVEVAQLTSEIPSLPGIKKSDVKMSAEYSANSNKIEYAMFKGVGLGDNFVISGKGKTRYTGYWVHMPIQYKDNKGNLFSGMLSIFGRVNETSTNKLKLDAVISNFLASLDFDNGLTKLSFDAHKNEVVEARVRKKVESELAQSANKNGKAETAAAPPAASIPAIKEIYMVDAEGNCFKFTDKSGFAPVSCPVHKSK